MFFLYFIIGSCFGSFLALVALRLPQGASILRPPSHCDHCFQRLRWFELIPIISLLCLQFRCRHCQQQISKISLLAELCCGFLLAFSLTGDQFTILETLWLFWAFTLALTDINYYLIEPRILLGGTAILWSSQLYQGAPLQLGSLIYCVFLCLILLAVLQGKFGLGDVLLLFSWAPWIPLLELCLLLILASTTGLLAFLILKRRFQPDRLPFVPFLAFGLLIIFFI